MYICGHIVGFFLKGDLEVLALGTKFRNRARGYECPMMTLDFHLYIAAVTWEAAHLFHVGPVIHFLLYFPAVKNLMSLHPL